MSNKNRDQFYRRFDAFQIPRNELDRMFEKEMEYQQGLWMAEQAYQASSTPGIGGGGSSSGLPSGCIQFVANTTDDTFFGMYITISSDTTYTVDWGDGNTEEGNFSTGGNDLSHQFDDSDTEYTVLLCFGSPSVVTSLDFYGND